MHPKARISDETFDDFLDHEGLLAVCEEDAIEEIKAKIKRMSSLDKAYIIVSVTALEAARLHIDWSDQTTIDIDLTAVLDDKAFAAVRDPALFATVKVGDWGHSITWSCGVELGADMLWLETLSAKGRADVRQVLEWRMRHGHSLAAAATALGISRRSVAYYSNGDRAVPRAILLACMGWEVSNGLPMAA